DGDLAEAKVRGREDTTHDHLFFLPVLYDPARITVQEVGQDLQDVPRTLRRNLAALVAEALAHRHPEAARVDELDLALAGRRLAVRDDPHIGRDRRVIEELLGQRDQRLEQVMLQDESPDFTLAAA